MNMIIALGIIQLCKMYGLTTRMCVKESQKISPWEWLISPTPNFLETGSLGPYPVREIEWIEINLTKIQPIGRLVPPKVIDYSDVIKQYLANIPTEISETENTIRVYLNFENLNHRIQS